MSGTRALKKTEIQRLLTVAAAGRHGLRDTAIVLVCLSGLRGGEAAQIRNSQILSSGKVTETFKLLRHQTKTSNTRNVFLTGQAIAACEAYLAVKKHLHDDGAFFETQKGEFSNVTMVKRLNLLLVKAGIPNATSHSLRKSCASMLMAKTGNVGFVASCLGHLSWEHTKRYTMGLEHNTSEFMAKVKW